MKKLNSSVRFLLVSGLLLTFGCSKSSSPNEATNPPQVPDAKVRTLADAKLIRSDYAGDEIPTLCKAGIDKADARLNALAAVPEASRNFDNTVLALENALADLNDETQPLTFMGYVSTDPAISAQGSACEESLSQFYVQVMARRALYSAVKDQVGRTLEESRLLSKIIESFTQSGMKLSDADLAKLTQLSQELAQKEALFAKHNNNDATKLLFTEAELAGVPSDFIVGLQKDQATGKLILNTKSTSYLAVMNNATLESTRKAMILAYQNRGMNPQVTPEEPVPTPNDKLLEQALQLRSQIAKLLGYDTWADYKTSMRMVKTKQVALDFMNGLRQKLAVRNQADLKQLLDYKKTLDPAATTVEAWDVPFLQTQLQKRDFNLDDEKVKEYFPADLVVDGMFAVYSKMLGVKYKRIVDAKVWAPGVNAYEMRNAADDRLIAVFYTDFIPRQGKYSHAAAFTLIQGRQLPDGYNVPVSSIVANFTPPQAGKPSLLTHGEVETVFHEFGHIMHQTLTRAPFTTVSGSSTARDFVEAPSQMLENWVWAPQVLNIISGHYLDHSQKLPSDMLAQLLAARDFQQGLFNTKQLLYGLFDMTIHTSTPPVDVTMTFDKLYKDIMGIEPVAGGHFAASFGHLMGGYDAGYYGYLWSKVYAEDMFTRFSTADLTDPTVGMRYRTTILEKGSVRDELDSLREFLGRDPNSDAFFKSLGL